MKIGSALRCKLAALVVAASLLAMPAVAHGALVEKQGTKVVFTATPGENNDLLVYQDGAGVGVHESNPLVPGPGCTDTHAGSYGTWVHCDGPVDAIDVSLGDGNDFAQVGDTWTPWAGMAATVDAGPGNDAVNVGTETSHVDGGPGTDNLQGGSGQDELVGGHDGSFDSLRGGAGDDRLVSDDGGSVSWGEQGNDVLVGGAGLDELFGNDSWGNGPDDGGADRLYGNGGGDYLDGELGPDVMSGGAGTDVVRYTGRSDDLAISLDGKRNDGAAGENDWIQADVESVQGGNGNDTITGSSSGEFLEGGLGADTIAGGGGDDHIVGDAGSDTLDGGPGNDYVAGGLDADQVTGGTGYDDLRGDEGNDVLIGRESPPTPDSLDCGTGSGDVAHADDGEGGTSCEHVDHTTAPPEDTTPPATGDGPWEQPAQLIGPPDEPNGSPQVVMTSKGEAVAAWAAMKNSDFPIHARWSVRKHGEPASAPRELPGDLSCCVDGIAADRDGNAVLVAQNTYGDIEVATRPPGGDFGAPVALARTNQWPLIASNGKGDIAVVWFDAEGGTFVASVRPNGGDFGTPVQVSDRLPVDPFERDVAFTDGGEVLVAWSDESYQHVYASVGSIDGTPQATQLLSTPLRMAADPRVAVDALGRAAAVWNESSAQPAYSDTEMIAMRPSGAGFDPGLPVPGAETGTAPGRVAMSADGRVTVAYGTTSYRGRVYSAQFGAPLERVRTFGLNSWPAIPELVTNRAGLVLVSWNADAYHLVTAFRSGDQPFGSVEDLQPSCDHGNNATFSLNEAGQGAAVVSDYGFMRLTTEVDPSAHGRADCAQSVVYGDDPDNPPSTVPPVVPPTGTPGGPPPGGPPPTPIPPGGAARSLTLRVSRLTVRGSSTKRMIGAAVECPAACRVRLVARLKSASGALLARASKRIRTKRPHADVRIPLRLRAASVRKLRAAHAGALLSVTAVSLERGGKHQRARGQLWLRR